MHCITCVFQPCLFCQASLIEQPPRCMENPGRSGAKLFVSYDRRLVIKSITSEEVALVHQILQPYHAVSVSGSWVRFWTILDDWQFIKLHFPL